MESSKIAAIIFAIIVNLYFFYFLWTRQKHQKQVKELKNQIVFLEKIIQEQKKQAIINYPPGKEAEL